jgi:hypothetical protein
MKNSGEDYLSTKTDNFVKGLFETSGSSRRKVSETGGDSKGNVLSATSAVKGSIVSTVTGESSVRKRKIIEVKSRERISCEHLLTSSLEKIRRRNHEWPTWRKLSEL